MLKTSKVTVPKNGRNESGSRSCKVNSGSLKESHFYIANIFRIEKKREDFLYVKKKKCTNILAAKS